MAVSDGALELCCIGDAGLRGRARRALAAATTAPGAPAGAFLPISILLARSSPRRLGRLLARRRPHLSELFARPLVEAAAFVPFVGGGHSSGS